MKPYELMTFAETNKICEEYRVKLNDLMNEFEDKTGLTVNKMSRWEDFGGRMEDIKTWFTFSVKNVL